MVGQGFYNRHSAPQWAAIEHVLPWLEIALESMELPVAPNAISLTDFGCSEGKNSIAVMQRLLPVLRRRTHQPLLTIHSDLPTNDFSELFKKLQADGKSVFVPEHTYASAVAGSMYDQLIPGATASVAMSFNAIGYLSRRPLDHLPGYILPNGPSAIRNIGIVSKEERAAFAHQAGNDMTAFLKARAAELVSGGKLLVQVFGADGNECTGDGIYDALNDAVLELCDAGRISREEYARYYQPIYFRTLAELVEPVSRPDAELASLYRLERAETYDATVPFVEHYRTNGDTAAFALAFTSFFRAFTEPVFRMTLRDRTDIDSLVSDLFSTSERLIRENPENYPFRNICVAALMTRL